MILVETSRPSRRRRHASVSWALALLGWLALALTYVPPTPIRAFVVIAFVLTGPGAGISGYLRERDPVEELAVVVGSSTACSALVAEALYLAGVGSPRLALALLAALTTVLAIGARPEIRSRVRRPRGGKR